MVFNLVLSRTVGEGLHARKAGYDARVVILLQLF